MTDLYDYHNGPNLGLEPPAAPQGEPSDEEIDGDDLDAASTRR